MLEPPDVKMRGAAFVMAKEHEEHIYQERICNNGDILIIVASFELYAQKHLRLKFIHQWPDDPAMFPHRFQVKLKQNLNNRIMDYVIYEICNHLYHDKTVLDTTQNVSRGIIRFQSLLEDKQRVSFEVYPIVNPDILEFLTTLAPNREINSVLMGFLNLLPDDAAPGEVGGKGKPRLPANQWAYQQ